MEKSQHIQIMIEQRIQALVNETLERLQGQKEHDPTFFELRGQAIAYRKAIQQVQVAFRIKEEQEE